MPPASRTSTRRIAGADVVIMLRLQKERMDTLPGLGEAEYFARYGLDRRASGSRANAMRS